jgi:rubrerythrin
MARSKSLTKQEFIKRAKRVHNDKYDYSITEYKNNKTKVKIICKKCGNIFEQYPENHLNGYGCSKC